jgi:hypothetical protein
MSHNLIGTELLFIEDTKDGSLERPEQLCDFPDLSFNFA